MCHKYDMRYVIVGVSNIIESQYLIYFALYDRTSGAHRISLGSRPKPGHISGRYALGKSQLGGITLVLQLRQLFKFSFSFSSKKYFQFLLQLTK
jgi:hypothetical protein